MSSDFVSKSKAQKVLVSSEKGFKDEHRANLSRNRFINSKQKQSQNTSSRKHCEQAQEGVLHWRSQDFKLLLESVTKDGQYWKTG
jgi:hypothetical protein